MERLAVLLGLDGSGSDELEFAFSDDPSDLWQVNGIDFQITEGVHVFCQMASVSREAIKNRCAVVVKLLNAIGWLRTDLPVLVDYSAKNAGAFLQRDSWFMEAYRKFTFEALKGKLPSAFVQGCQVSTPIPMLNNRNMITVLEIVPEIIIRELSMTRPELRADLALQIVTHELAHALGVNFSGPETPEQERNDLEMLADAIAFKAGLGPETPLEYHTFFRYLGASPEISAAQNNSIFGDIAETVIQQMRRDR